MEIKIKITRRTVLLAVLTGVVVFIYFLNPSFEMPSLKDIKVPSLNIFSTAEDHVNKAEEYYESGQYDRSVRELDEAAAKTPDSADIYLRKGLALKEKKEYALSAQSLNKAAHLDPRGKTGRAAFDELKNMHQALCDYKFAKLDEKMIARFRGSGRTFDEGLALYQQKDNLRAEQVFKQALAECSSSRHFYRDRKDMRAFYFTIKAFIFLCGGNEQICVIKPQDDNYMCMVQMRRSYYLLALARAYFKRALKDSQGTNFTPLIEQYNGLNEQCVAIVKKFFPQVDNNSKRFMNSMDAEASMIVNFDVTNNLLAAGDREGAWELINENEKYLSKIMAQDTANAGVYVPLCAAYKHMINAHTELHNIKLNAGTIQAYNNHVNNCVGNLNRALQMCADKNLARLCAEVRQNILNLASTAA